MDKLYFLYDLLGKRTVFDDEKDVMNALVRGKYGKLTVYEGTSVSYSLTEVMKNPCVEENEILCRTKSFKS